MNISPTNNQALAPEKLCRSEISPIFCVNTLRYLHFVLGKVTIKSAVLGTNL